MPIAGDLGRPTRLRPEARDCILGQAYGSSNAGAHEDDSYGVAWEIVTAGTTQVIAVFITTSFS